MCVCQVASVTFNSLQPYGLQPTRLLCPWDSPGKNTGAGCHFLLQGLFPTQGSNLHLLRLLYCRHILYCWRNSDQIRSVTQSCPTLRDPMNHSTPGLPVHHQLPEFTQTHVHQVSDAIQPSYPLSSSSPLVPNPSQHQSLQMSQLFAWGGQSTGVSALASFLPKKFQSWSPSEWTGWISLQSEGLSDNS